MFFVLFFSVWSTSSSRLEAWIYHDDEEEYTINWWERFVAWTITITDKENCITILDRNLWATSNDISSPTSYGYHYQRGNNHGFTRIAQWSSEFVPWNETISERWFIDSADYWPNNRYDSTNFITDPDRENHEGWDSQPYNNNLRWWEWDNSNNWDSWNEREERSWPCPEWSHVPSIKERNNLLNMYYSINPSGELNENNYDYSITDDTFRNNFTNAFMIPLAGYRDAQSAVLYGTNESAKLWSSSPSNTDYPISDSFIINEYSSNKQISSEYGSRRGNAQSIRCFLNESKDIKNSSQYPHEDKTITYDTREILPIDTRYSDWYFWSNKEVKTKEITYSRSEESRTYIPNEEIENPHREWFIFNWWYIDKWEEDDELRTWLVIDSTPKNLTVYAHWERATWLSSSLVTPIEAPWAEWYGWLKFDDGSGHVIMLLDRNLWASSTWAGTKSTSDSYWYTYQRGNNHWFMDSEDINDLYSNTKLTRNNNFNNSNFSNNKFITSNVSYGYDYRSDSSYSSVNHPNLRWGWNDNEENLWWLKDMTEQNIKNRRWPCPEWYHVPSIWEWNALLTYWGFAFNKIINHQLFFSEVGIHWLKHLYSNVWYEFADAFNIPFAGYRNSSNDNSQSYQINYYKWQYGYLRSSSPDSINKIGPAPYQQLGYIPSASLWLSISRGFDIDYYLGDVTLYNTHHRANGYPIRCFYDSYLFPYHYSLMNGDKELMSWNVKLNDKLIDLIDSSIIGEWNPYEYRYIEWWDNTIHYNFSTPITENIILKAKHTVEWNNTIYTLTINYQYEWWWTAKPTYTATLNAWSNYNVQSPTIEWYTANKTNVSGTLNSNTTITVTYTKNTSSWWDTWWWGWGWWTTSTSNSIALTTNRSNPYTSQYINLTINNTNKNYTDKLYLSAKYRSSSSSDWYSISNVSSTYFSDYSNEREDGYYKMKESDNWKVTLTNLVQFKKSGYYRIYVKDINWNEKYISFTVDSDDDTSSENEYLDVSISPSSPDTDEWIKLNIETDDDYTWKISFSKFQYKSSSSSSWSTIPRISSTYVSEYSSTRSNGYYKMKSSDDGEVTLKNLIKFKKGGYYRIYVEDTDDNEEYVQFYVESDDDEEENNSNKKSKIAIDITNQYPYTNNRIWIIINVDTDYTWKINFKKIEYYNNSSRKDVSSSSEYIWETSNEWDNWYYKMVSNDYGYKRISNFIKLKKEWKYRIYAETKDWVSDYIQFSVTEYNSTEYNETYTNTGRTETSTDDDIEAMLNQLLNPTWYNYTWSSYTESTNLYIDTSDEIYKSRSCKEYKLQYNSDLWAFTSPDLQKTEYFINKDYFKRYIDSKNPRKEWCPSNEWWISSSYVDNSNSTDKYIAPNWKIYIILYENWKYHSNQLTKTVDFSSYTEIKYYIRDRNPLINMATNTK